MKHQLGMLLGFTALVAVPAMAQQQAPNPNQVAGKALLQAADKAIGASNVKSFTATATGWMGYPGQQFATGDLPRSDLKSYTVTFDLASKSAKWDYVRVQGNNPARGGGAGFPVQGEVRFQEFANGNIGWNVNPQGQATRVAGDAAADRVLRLYTNPVGFIQAGLAANNAAATDRYFARQNKSVKVVAFTTKVCDGPQPYCTRRITGEFDKDNLLERVITWVPDPVLGDKMVELRFSDYKDVGGGVKMAHRVHAHQGDHPLIPGGHNWLDLRISKFDVNVANAAQSVPDAVRSAEVPTVNRVVATKLADGVVLMGGGSHNSVAVEFKDYVTVIEGPLSNQRTNAVVAEVRKTFPNKPIRYLVNTHNHFDHLGGVRGYVAEGATVITDEKNRNFYQRVVLAPQSRTLSPDRLSQRPAAPTGPGQLQVQGFSDHYTISDGNQTIELHHVDGLNHTDNMLVAYLPKQKILVSADMGGPPPAGSPAPANISNNSIVLYNNIKRLKLDVTTHVPIHGNPGPQAEFDRIVAPAAARAPQQQGGGG
jgi:glyoxylase-like metal-dependent hydrolase (beta-lactamase superfamily II)